MDSGPTPSTASSTEPDGLDLDLLLNRLQQYKNAPRGVAESWAHAEGAAPNTTERIFYEAGFTAWFAYFFARNSAENQLHFSGKAEVASFLHNLDTKDAESRKRLATSVAAAVSPDLHERINRLQKTSILRPNKRRRTYSL